VNDDDDNNSMEQSPSGESNSHVATQEIPRILWTPNVHHGVHKTQTNPRSCETDCSFVPQCKN